MNWPGRRREEGGSELLAHIRVIQVLPVADNWIDEDDLYRSCALGIRRPPKAQSVLGPKLVILYNSPVHKIVNSKVYPMFRSNDY